MSHLGNSGADFYTLGKALRQDGALTVFEAEERSASAPCYLHRIVFQDQVSAHQRQTALSFLKRYAALQFVRTPRLADAWFTDTDLTWVEYKIPVQPMNFAEANPLAGTMSFGRFCTVTLEMLASLHFCGLVHRFLLPQSYGIGPGGRVYLDDTGAPAALLEIFSGGMQEMGLSTDLYSRDIARWAWVVISMKLRQPATQVELLEERWDDYQLRIADGQLRKVITDPRSREFFIDCFNGFTPAGCRFDQATDVLKFWRTQALEDYVQ